jgi:glycerol kinase
VAVTATAGVLVVDVGTSQVRTAVVRPDASVEAVVRQPLPPSSPGPGLVEFDPAAMADAVLACAGRTLADAGPVDAVGIANQRASTVVWDRASRQPVAPGVGWQDLRTVGTCLALRGQGIRLGPSESATKLAAVLDAVDPDRRRNLCFGTVDSWVAQVLSAGALHVTDPTNAAVTGLLTAAGDAWNPEVAEALRIPSGCLPTIVDTSGVVGEARALPGSPPIAGICGDQQASLIGQGCVHPGTAKATFGSGGMLDACVGPTRPAFARQGAAGTVPVVAWRRAGSVTWGVEAVMLTAGTCIDWLCDDLGLLPDPAASDRVAASCADSGGVVFVPALLGLGTPVWDYGARGTLLGLTRGSGRAEIVRAVLEGIAHRGADLLEAAEADAAITPATLRVDGAMSANETFVTALAEAIGRPVEVSAQLEATALGAGFVAGLAVGLWADEAEVAEVVSPARVVEPTWPADRRLEQRRRWLDARCRAERTIPELSALEF